MELTYAEWVGIYTTIIGPSGELRLRCGAHVIDMCPHRGCSIPSLEVISRQRGDENLISGPVFFGTQHSPLATGATDVDKSSSSNRLINLAF